MHNHCRKYVVADVKLISELGESEDIERSTGPSPQESGSLKQCVIVGSCYHPTSVDIHQVGCVDIALMPDGGGVDGCCGWAGHRFVVARVSKARVVCVMCCVMCYLLFLTVVDG